MPSDVPHPQAVLRGHRGEVQALEFDGSERWLVSGDSLGEVRVWDLGDLRPAAIRRLHPLAGGILSLRLFRSGGQRLLGTQGRDGVTMLWDCGSGGSEGEQHLQLSEQPVRSYERDCYSFCRFAVLPGEPFEAALRDQQQQQSRADNLQGNGHSGSRPSEKEEERQQQQEADEFLAAVLADTGLGEAGPSAVAPKTTPTAAATAPEQHQQQQQQQQDGSGAADTPGRSASSPAPSAADAGAAIWALHPCSQASQHHPPALAAIPGSDERTAEVVCCSCGQQVAEFREAAAGRKLGMLMAVQLYCMPQAAAAGTAAEAAAAPNAPSLPPPLPPPPPSICLAAAYEDGSLVVWELSAPRGAPPLAHRQLCQEPVTALCLDSSCAGGAVGSAEDQVVVFKLDHAARRISLRHTIELRRQGIGDVAVRPDRRLLATAGWDGRVRVYKYKSGRPLAILKYHSSPVTGIQFAPRSMVLATAARDGTLALWPLFQPDGQHPQ